MSYFKFSLDYIPQYILFYAVIIFLVLADIQIIPLFFDLNLRATLTLAAIYYWSVFHPRLMPAWLLFILGFTKDLLCLPTTIGLSAIIFIFTHLLVKRQRVFLSGQSFFMMWAVYMLITFLMCFIFWVVGCLSLSRLISLWPFISEYTVIIIAFPLVLYLMGWLHKLLPFARPDKASL